MEKIEELLKTGNTAIVDVRTPGEFSGGHVAGSINIPLNELPHRTEELRSFSNIVLCCASGMRSASATDYLSMQGFRCINGGPWTNVNYFVNNKN